ncbi:MAG: hypothetical protein ACLR43_00065 [Faecalibacillus faecis]
MAFAVGYRATVLKINIVLTSGFLSLFVYMLLVPLDTTTLADSGIISLIFLFRNKGVLWHYLQGLLYLDC